MPFACVREHVKPERIKNKRALYAKFWWRHVEPRPGMFTALSALPRFLVTVAVSKHRLFARMEAPTLPDHRLFAFGVLMIISSVFCIRAFMESGHARKEHRFASARAASITRRQLVSGRFRFPTD
jgi:hypothetical protein